MKDDVYKIKDLHKVNIHGKSLIVKNDESDSNNIEVWSTDTEDEEVRKPTHGACFVSNMYTSEKGGKCFICHN